LFTSENFYLNRRAPSRLSYYYQNVEMWLDWDSTNESDVLPP